VVVKEINEEVTTESERLFAALIWILSLVTTFLGPIILWLIKKDSKFVTHNFKLYIDLLISSAIYGFVFGLLALVLIGIPLLFALGIYVLVMTIIAAVKAGQGTYYKIPLIIPIFAR